MSRALGHREDGHRRGNGRTGRDGQLGLVGQRVLDGLVQLGLPEGDRRAEAGGRAVEQEPRRLGTRRAETLELDVRLVEDVTSGHQAGDGHEGGGHEGPVLK